MRYIVKSVVCDYGVFEKIDNEEQLKVICNSLSNAELISDILNTDLRNTKYEVIGRSKIDKAIKEIKGIQTKTRWTEDMQEWACCKKVLDILEGI